jgi:hypothetical protein
MLSALPATQDVLLRRRGLVFAAPPSPPDTTVDTAADTTADTAVDTAADTELLPTERHLQAVEIDWADLGFVPSSRLRAALARLPLSQLAEVRQRVITVLAKQLGAHVRYEALFRKFPHHIPNDTYELWLRKVLSHFLQETDQPCLFCRAIGTTHVLSPCLHVVCERCFDGENYSACPVCERAVDRSSPFFRPTELIHAKSREPVVLKLLDLGGEIEAEARKLVAAFCERKQAMSPNDRSDFETVLLDVGEPILTWLPAKIPVKENIALIFGALFAVVDPAIVLPVAARHMKTATDVLRFLAVLSGTDGSLQPTARYVKVEREVDSGRWWGAAAKMLGIDVPKKRVQPVYVTMQVRRFRMTKLGRPLRRTLLALLESFVEESLIEDMLRHRSYWVWAGEFLHPHEYAKRFPKVARAFQVVRKFAPDGTRAPVFHTFCGKLELAARAKDPAKFIVILRDRPGEFGRRFDHAVRVAAADEEAQDMVLQGFLRVMPRLSTPVLLTLYGLLPTRTRRAASRVYWPKGPVTTGVSRPDERPTLPSTVVEPAVASITTELLRRFGEKPAFASALIDTALCRVLVPFNERTASRAAVALPRGSVVAVPREKIVRLFLHWCQPQRGGTRTDIDLSVGFYTDAWREAGVCSYYSLKMKNRHGEPMATSSGDRTDAPFPDGASEFIDLDWQRARAHGIRYAVMLVNAYSGMPFSLLERGFAGLMLRKSDEGQHFDPRTVELRFDLQGDNGIYMPLVFDLQEGVMHWLDVYSHGEFNFNNAATSNRAITRICPTLIEYFGSGVRPSMFELSLLHAAARSPIVMLRDRTLRSFTRRDNETALDFHTRITSERGDSMPALSLEGGASFAALYRGDLDLSPETTRYVLFPDRASTTLSASDLIS